MSISGKADIDKSSVAEKISSEKVVEFRVVSWTKPGNV
jgi:hypothetical protein